MLKSNLVVEFEFSVFFQNPMYIPRIKKNPSDCYKLFLSDWPLFDIFFLLLHHSILNLKLNLSFTDIQIFVKSTMEILLYNTKDPTKAH